MNLRLPGQYFDAETGLNYNYFRDYEPGTGRYVESDPVGLKGGVSTYSYVASQPTGRIDRWGLWCIPMPDETTDWTTFRKVANPDSKIDAVVNLFSATCVFVDAWHIYQERMRRTKSFCRECIAKDSRCPNGEQDCQWVWKYGLWRREVREIFEPIFVPGVVTDNYGSPCASCRNPFTGVMAFGCEGGGE
jgi:RHS repeat-associated protein